MSSNPEKKGRGYQRGDGYGTTGRNGKERGGGGGGGQQTTD